MNLQGKVVVITGASKGLGAALAKLLSKEGSKLVISARSEEELAEVAKATGAVAVRCDVSIENQVKNLAEETVKRFGRIDIWINNAGVRVPQEVIETVDMKRVKQMFEINVFGTMHGAREALKQMKSQKHGTIVNILSTAALEGKPNRAAYASSKFALIGFTQAIRQEAAPFGISVVAIYPGGMQTNFFDEQKPSDYSEFMDPGQVAEKIVENLKAEKPQEELILKRSST